jgi:hypothetical protein
MKAINQNYPNIKILLTFGYSKVVWDKKWNKLPLNEQIYGLLPSFLDGMLESINPEAVIYDGYEFSYGYKSEKAFQQSYEDIYELKREVTDLKEDFDRYYRVSFGLWLDYNMRGHEWNQQDVKKNYFNPREFESSLRYALRYSDRYVWIYSQKANWWNGKVPQPYIDALKKVKTNNY